MTDKLKPVLDDENPLKPVLDALEEYTNVVSSKNSPDSFAVEIEDEGIHARKAIKYIKTLMKTHVLIEKERLDYIRAIEKYLTDKYFGTPEWLHLELLHIAVGASNYKEVLEHALPPAPSKGRE